MGPFLDAAGPVHPTEGMWANFDSQKVGLFILKECARRKTPAWRPDAVKEAKTDSQKLAIKLADTYLHGQRPEKAEAIYEQLLAGGPPLGKPSKAVEAYCVMKLALAYSKHGNNHDKCIEYYKRFLKKDYADLPWAASALMRLAVLDYNTTQDPRAAIPRYQYIITKYPQHPDAERAMYFLALAAVRAGEKAVAEATCKEFIEKYPHSDWKNHVQRVLKDKVPKLKDKGQGDDK